MLNFTDVLLEAAEHRQADDRVSVEFYVLTRRNMDPNTEPCRGANINKYIQSSLMDRQEVTV